MGSPPKDVAAPTDASEMAGFLASKNSEVFHQTGCKSAAKIAARNLIRYGSREEAILAGKRPCEECRP